MKFEGAKNIIAKEILLTRLSETIMTICLE